MFEHKNLLSALVFIVVMVTSVFVLAADQPYILTFTEGKTVVLMRVTRTDTGIRFEGQPVIHQFGRTVGTTAVDPIVDSSGNLSEVNVYVSYVASNNLPAVSLLKFNGQLQNLSETALPKLKLGQYHPLHVFRFGAAKRLLGAGPFGSALANDYVAYTLDANGIATGAKKTVFQNANGLSIFSATASADGGMFGEMLVDPSAAAAAGSSSVSGNRHKIMLRPGDLANLGPIQQFVLVVGVIFLGYDLDISNPIPLQFFGSSMAAGTRYVAFRTFEDPGTANSRSRIWIQNVDSTTAVVSSAARPITNFAKAPNVSAEIFQSLALAPDGRLIAFTVNGPCGRQIVKFQALKNGLKSGGPKIGFGCDKVTADEVAYGLDIAALSTQAAPAGK